jgi:hypothetical protein
VHDVHAINDFAKHDMFVVEKWGWHSSDEELATVCVCAGVLGKQISDWRWQILTWCVYNGAAVASALSTYGHAQEPGSVMFKLEVLVGEVSGPIDWGGPGAVAMQKVTPLDHEILNLAQSHWYGSGRFAAVWRTYDSVNPAELVALGAALGILGFASAELTEVFSSFGSDVCKKLHFDATKGFAWAKSAPLSKVSWRRKNGGWNNGHFGQQHLRSVSFDEGRPGQRNCVSAGEMKSTSHLRE